VLEQDIVIHSEFDKAVLASLCAEDRDLWKEIVELKNSVLEAHDLPEIYLYPRERPMSVHQKVIKSDDVYCVYLSLRSVNSFRVSGWDKEPWSVDVVLEQLAKALANITLNESDEHLDFHTVWVDFLKELGVERKYGSST
jgi:hypothetical protein